MKLPVGTLGTPEGTLKLPVVVSGQEAFDNLTLAQIEDFTGKLKGPPEGPFTEPKFFSIWHCRVIPKLQAKFQSKWSPFEALLWRGRTTIGSPRSPDIPHGPINSGDGSSIATLNKRFDCPDCEDSRALSFVFHPQEFHILSFILGIQYPNLID
ncbi:hypothetical protein Tco_0567865 [Tanacetum coccineum]